MKPWSLLLSLLLFGSASSSAAEKPIVLWPEGAPGALGTAAKDIPTLTPYVPAKASGAAMLLKFCRHSNTRLR